MKKYLVYSLAALAFASCNKFDIQSFSQEELVIKDYSAKFINSFGQPAANQDWGFGTGTTKGFTRTITVNGDAYDKFPSANDVAAYFPTAIPADADEVSQLETLYKGTKVQTQYGETTMWDIYAIYQHKIVEGYNLKITQAGVSELGGNYQNSGWDGTVGKEIAHPYNVYVDVDGDVTIRRVGATHFNLYILRGNVTIESNYGEQAGLISVASGATLNDQRNSIAANQGVKMFNRGTINATNTQKYDIGNFCTVYNEGKFNVSGALTYSPGDANDSYFMNLGDDAELTALAMTLNSTGNFFNSGKVIISGETLVTQARLYWVNAGYYKTGTMTFSAKNTTFYNYCQLIVTGNAHMFDGEFNLMTNSYTEAGSGEFDNFIVNMDSNTGMYIKGDVRMVAQGDGTYQGWRTDGSNDYLLIGGKVTVDAHYHTFSVSSGITYSVNQIEIVRGEQVVTDPYLKDIGDGAYPVLDLNGTECPYGQLTVTPNEGGCGATWTTGGGNTITYQGRIMAEDLTVASASDWDFNDVVFDWAIKDGKAYIKLLAAGGQLSLTIGGELNDEKTEVVGGVEIHEKFGVATSVMVNTGLATADPVEFVLNDGKTYTKPDEIKLYVKKSGIWMEITAEQAKPAGKFNCKVGTKWCDEYVNIKRVYPLFAEWVINTEVDWAILEEDKEYLVDKILNNNL